MLRPRRGGGCGGGGGCENLSCTYKLWRVNISQFECYIWVSIGSGEAIAWPALTMTNHLQKKTALAAASPALTERLCHSSMAAELFAPWILLMSPLRQRMQPFGGQLMMTTPSHHQGTKRLPGLRMRWLTWSHRIIDAKKGMIRDVWMQFIDGCLGNTSLTKRWCFVRKKTHAVTAMLGEAVKCTHAFPTYPRVVV